MSMGAHKLEKKLSRFIGMLIQKKLLSQASITVRYVDKPAVPDVDYDPNVESTYPTLTPKSVTVGALVHIVSVRTTQRQFTEIKTGDAIVTFETTPRDQDNQPVDFTKMDQVTFEFNGDKYVQAATGKELAQYWDAVVGGVPVSQTLLLRLTN